MLADALEIRIMRGPADVVVRQVLDPLLEMLDLRFRKALKQQLGRSDARAMTTRRTVDGRRGDTASVARYSHGQQFDEMQSVPVTFPR